MKTFKIIKIEDKFLETIEYKILSEEVIDGQKWVDEEFVTKDYSEAQRKLRMCESFGFCR